MTTLYLALLAVWLTSGTVIAYVGLVMLPRQAEKMYQPLPNLAAYAPSTWVLKNPVAGESGNEKWTGQWYDDETNPDICSLCGRARANRIGAEWELDGGTHAIERAGSQHDERPVEDADTGTRWFHYVPRAYQREWETLGWEVKEIGAPHDSYSLLGEWKGVGPPLKP